MYAHAWPYCFFNTYAHTQAMLHFWLNQQTDALMGPINATGINFW